MNELLIDLTTTTGAGRPADPERRALTLAQLQELGAWGALRELRRDRVERCVVRVHDFRAQGRWLGVIALGLAVRARRRELHDPVGAQRRLTFWSALTRELPFAGWRAAVCWGLRAGARRLIRRLPPARGARPVRPRRVAFFRVDLTPSLRAGGSVTHIHGVIGGLAAHGVEVAFVTPGSVGGFAEDGRSVIVIPPDPRWRLSAAAPHLAYNRLLLPRADELLGAGRFDAVYLRYGLGVFAPALAARRRGVPLVVEYNGSETWVARHWGVGLTHPRLFATIERRTLRAADLVVAVSAPLADELRALGVAAERILVNPNGVDPERFDPQRLCEARAETRRRLGVDQGELLVVFVGTFGPWHGSEVLAQAAGLVAPAARRRLRYLLVGEGATLPATRALFREAGLDERCTFTGLVGRDGIPDLLAAADLCLSPHVPNPDGSRFFGSPTKLFEYMAAGRAIVASNLDQIGEVLEHGRNAWLVQPGDPVALAQGIERLAADGQLRERLGRAARCDATERHSWRAHVGRILERLAHPAEAP